MNLQRSDLPEVRGNLRQGVALGPLAWLRVGGPADWLFQPADLEDLCDFLKNGPSELTVMPMGVASNLLVRDGGIRGLVVRLSGPLSKVAVEDRTVIAGCGALDQRVAQVASRAGISGLEFMIGIPGTIGGAVRMNAGAFGGETADRLLWIEAVDRSGELHRVDADELTFTYRRSSLPQDWIAVRAAFEGEPGDREAIAARMVEIKQEREAAQPMQVATGGSTFKNPAGRRAWQLIDDAGCRGLHHGEAMMSEKHCNFMINLGGATALQLEQLGEKVRSRVLDTSGIELEWEIHRIGEQVPEAVAA